MGIDQIFNLENEIFGGLLGVTSIGLVAAMSKKAAQVSNLGSGLKFTIRTPPPLNNDPCISISQINLQNLYDNIEAQFAFLGWIYNV